MPATFSLLSWNVEHLRPNPNRTTLIADKIKEFDPDVFAIYEVEDISVSNLMNTHFPTYDFFITDGPQVQEILVGCRRGKFDQKIFTQKREFDAGNQFLRPGALLSLLIGGKFYNMLFLHTDSGTDASAFGNRFEMMDKVKKLAKAINRKYPNSGLLVTGDLNTMGMVFPTNTKKNQRVTAEDEINGMMTLFAKHGITIAPKEHNATWLSDNATYMSNLDHVLHNANITLNVLGQNAANEDYTVKVDGWQGLTKSQQLTFLANYSDHCLLYCEIQ